MKVKNKGALREILVYLSFGTMTTAIALGLYFGILWFGESILLIPAESNSFNAVRAAAEILQWIAAVLFAFVTNKKWVFKNADNSVSTLTQLIRFSASRLITLGIDAAITFGTVWILHGLDVYDVSLAFIGLDKLVLSADFMAKMLASWVVVVSNYILSKLFVFKATELKKKK